MESSAPITLETVAPVRPLRMGLVMMNGELTADGEPVDMICFASPRLLALAAVDDKLMDAAESFLLDPAAPPVPVQLVAMLLSGEG